MGHDKHKTSPKPFLPAPTMRRTDRLVGGAQEDPEVPQRCQARLGMRRACRALCNPLRLQHMQRCREGARGPACSLTRDMFHGWSKERRRPASGSRFSQKCEGQAFETAETLLIDLCRLRVVMGAQSQKDLRELHWERTSGPELWPKRESRKAAVTLKAAMPCHRLPEAFKTLEDRPPASVPMDRRDCNLRCSSARPSAVDPCGLSLCGRPSIPFPSHGPGDVPMRALRWEADISQSSDNSPGLQCAVESVDQGECLLKGPSAQPLLQVLLQDPSA